jgi:hypothetical protein
MQLTIEQLIRSLFSAGVERAKARYVVADALAIHRGYFVQNGADGAQNLRAADAAMEESIPSWD